MTLDGAVQSRTRLQVRTLREVPGWSTHSRSYAVLFCNAAPLTCMCLAMTAAVSEGEKRVSE